MISRAASPANLSGLGGLRCAAALGQLFAPESANPRMIFFFFSALVMALACSCRVHGAGFWPWVRACWESPLFFSEKAGTANSAHSPSVFASWLFLWGAYRHRRTLRRFEQVQQLEERLFITRTVVPMVAAYLKTALGGATSGMCTRAFPRMISTGSLPADTPTTTGSRPSARWGWRAQS